MKSLLTGLLVLLLAGSSVAQNPREVVQLNGFPGGTAFGTALGTDQDLSAAFYFDEFDHRIKMVTSDGRGINWSLPMIVDTAATPYEKFLIPESAAVAGDNIYISWLDHRQPVVPTGPKDICFNVSYDQGLTFQYTPFDLIIDKGLLAFGNDIIDYKMIVDARHELDPFDDLIAFAILVENDLNRTGEVFLNYSLDSGQTFLPTAIPVSMSMAPPHAISLDMDIEEEMIYVVWEDAFASPGVYMSSFNAYLETFVFQDVLVNEDTFGLFQPEGMLAIDVRELAPGEQTIAILWLQREFLQLDHSLWGNVFVWDGALTSSGDALIGSYAPTVDVDNPDVAIAGTGYVVAVWEDDRMGFDRVFTTLTKDGGLTWLPDTVLSQRQAGFPQVLSPRQTVVATWVNDFAPQTLEASLSIEAGEFWKQPITISDPAIPVEKHVVALNMFYTNFIMAWQGPTGFNKDLYAGGFRPQTVNAVGNFHIPFTPVYFELSNWCQKDHLKEFSIVASASLGTITLPDGRLLGLANDTVFGYTYPFSPILSGVIDHNGTGVTPPFPSPGVPFTLYVVAVSYLPPGTPEQIGSFTDVLVVN